MAATPLPRMMGVRRSFPASPAVDPRAAVRRGFGALEIPDGARIAVAVGSRGITNLGAVVESVVELLRERGARPFIVPAMGSHGSGTPEGQRGILAGFGITADRLGVPVDPSMETERVGSTEEGVPVYVGAAALRSDGIVLINRVKPHTDFVGKVGSGLSKMLAIGLSKRDGAAACHAAAARLGFEPVIRSVARVALRAAPVLAGVAILEGPLHETAGVEVLGPEEILSREEELHARARTLMPGLPFGVIDLLIVDRMGKNFSGTGMDTNVIGRGVEGYSTSLAHEAPVRRLFVRDLDPGSHGNALGIGLADFATARLVRAIDRRAMATNVLTSLNLHLAKLPLYFETDREAISRALESLVLPDPRAARVVRIRDTLSLAAFEASEVFREEVERRADLAAAGGARDMAFDASGNLVPFDFGSTDEL